MSLLEWRDAYRIGIAEVDYEHRELIAQINTLLELSRGGGKVAVMDALGELHAAIAAHFALEEKLMRSQRYSGYAEHKQDHEQLLDELRDIMDAQERADSYDAAGLAEALGSWFMQHFGTHDARWHKSRQQAQSAGR
jgi:hemerythrin